MAEVSAERFSDYWDSALDGESLFEIYASAATETGTSPLSIATLLCLPRWPAPGELSDGYRISWVLNIVVSGFDDFAHRMGLSRAMSRGLFLPVSLRIPLLAGVAISMRDPKAILSSLYAHALPRARQRFAKVDDAFTSSWSASLKLTANLRFQRATISSQNARVRQNSTNLTPRRPVTEMLMMLPPPWRRARSRVFCPSTR